MKHKLTSEIVREYIARVNQYPDLSLEEEAHLIGRGWSGDSPSVQVLTLCSLRRVIYPARRVAWSHYERHDYWPALRELIAAGNEGLLIALERFRLDSGALFRTAAQHSIKKELIRQALWDRSTVTHPYDVTPPSRDVRLDALRGREDAEIEIPDGPVSPRRYACIIPDDEGKQPGPESFSEVLPRGYAKLAATDNDDSLNRKIWVAVRRLRYERPALPTRLKVIAKDLGCSDARISQITGKTSKKIHAAVMSDAGERRVRHFPSWRTIDDWCDKPKQYREQSIADWHDACDFQLWRVHQAIRTGSELPTELQFTTPDGYTPAAHFTKLVIHREIAVQQDAERTARVEAFRAFKLAEILERCAKYNEQQITLTTKGYEKVRELEQHREAEDAEASSAGSDHARAGKKSSAA